MNEKLKKKLFSVICAAETFSLPQKDLMYWISPSPTAEKTLFTQTLSSHDRKSNKTTFQRERLLISDGLVKKLTANGTKMSVNYNNKCVLDSRLDNETQNTQDRVNEKHIPFSFGSNRRQSLMSYNPNNDFEESK